MKSYLSILRGINLGKHKKINMNDLKALYESMAFKNVKTYIQSGNVVFDYKNTEEKVLAKQIEKEILEKYKFDVPVIIRTDTEIKNVITNNPFLKEENIELDKLHVTFLAEVAKQENIDKIKALDYGEDRFLISDKDIYLYCPGGYGKTKLSNNFFENKLKVTATTRNWRTVNELAKMLE